ncbi:MAG: RNA polymerase sigma factor [Candidatus Binatia bacterium]
MEISSRGATDPVYPAGIPPAAFTPPITESDPRGPNADVIVFRDLFRKHAPQVVGLASHFARTRNRAEEIAEDAFLRVFRERARYPLPIRFTKHLYRVTTELCFAESRRSADRLAEEAARRLAPADVPARLRAAVDRLPTDKKIAFLLSRVDDLSYADIADCLGASHFTVKSLIYTATEVVRTTLRDLLPS